MRDLIVTENITIDGVIESADWYSVEPDPDAPPDDRPDVGTALHAHMAASDAVLFGRKTFEDMRSYWPNQVDDTTGVTDHLNRVTKYVASRTIDDPKWANTTVLRGPLAEEVRALKALPGKDIVATGSISLVRSLIAADLVEEYRLFVYPTVFGHGERLFADAATIRKLKLVESTAFRDDIVLLRYRMS